LRHVAEHVLSCNVPTNYLSQALRLVTRNSKMRIHLNTKYLSARISSICLDLRAINLLMDFIHYF